MYKAIAFSLRAPYLQSQEGLEQWVVGVKSERRGLPRPAGLQSRLPWLQWGLIRVNRGTPAPMHTLTHMHVRTHSHTCMYTHTHSHTHTHTHTHMHTHPGFQRSPISVNIPTMGKTEGPTWHQSSGRPSEMPPLAGPRWSWLVPAWPLRPRTGPALKVLTFLHLSEVRRGLVACSQVRRPGLVSPTPPWSVQVDSRTSPFLGLGGGATDAALWPDLQ